MKMAAKRRATDVIDVEQHQYLMAKKVKKPNEQLANAGAYKTKNEESAQNKNEKRKQLLQKKVETQHREWEVQWLRHEVELDTTSSDPIHFQQIDVQRYQNILLMFGSTPDGQSVACFIKNIPSLEEINAKFCSSNWITLLPGMYEPKTGEKRTRCQIEVDITFDNVVVDNHPGQGMAPFRILCIEAEAVDGSVISIANMVIRTGDNEPFIRNIFTTSAVNTIDGTQVWICKDEKELLQTWMDFVAKIDPDILTGYNIYKSDFPLLYDRMNILVLPNWQSMGRINERSAGSDSALPLCDVEYVEGKYDLKGIVPLDAYNFVRANYGVDNGFLKSYKLEDACVLIGQRIVCFPAKKMKQYKVKTDGSMGMALFTLKKAYVSLMMLTKLNALEGYFGEMQDRSLQYSTLRHVLDDEIKENDSDDLSIHSINSASD